MANFTKGPWVETPDDLFDKFIVAGDATVLEYGGCGTHKLSYDNPADMVLILAATELYEALQSMVADFGYGYMDDANLLYELNEGNEGVRCLIQARAALAKAVQ